jgi:Na+-driven multidrug efflux pump
MGQFIGLAILARYFFSGNSMLTLSLREIRLRWRVIKRICEIGLASFFAQMSHSVSGALLNTALSVYGGDAAMTSAGAMSSMATLAFMPILGLQQGLGPIIGYNHGMGSKERVRSALFRGVLVGMIISTVIFILLEGFPVPFASLFIDPSSATMEVCVRAMRISFITLPFLAINIVGSSYFQSTAQAIKSLVLNTSRAVIFLIPAILILPRFFGLDGAWASQPVADVFSVTLTIIFLCRSLSKTDEPAIKTGAGAKRPQE